MIVNIHASCVVLARAGEPFGAPADWGVLLLGDSGAGKSDLALRLIGRGALLVADDRCDLMLAADGLHARAPRPLKGLVEVRGLGILHLPDREHARIGLAVRLASPAAVARFPEPARYRPPPELEAPESLWPAEIALAPFETSAPEKLLAASALLARRATP